MTEARLPLIGFALGNFMEVLDTTIANVAVPHIAGATAAGGLHRGTGGGTDRHGVDTPVHAAGRDGPVLVLGVALPAADRAGVVRAEALRQRGRRRALAEPD